jgi:hypothetical protein
VGPLVGEWFEPDPKVPLLISLGVDRPHGQVRKAERLAGKSACSISRSDGLADHFEFSLSVRFIGRAGDVHPGIEGPAIGHTAKNRSSKVEFRFAIEVPTRSNLVADPVTSGSGGTLIRGDGSGSGGSLIAADAGSRDGTFRCS